MRGATDIKAYYHIFFACLFCKVAVHFNTIRGRIPRQKMATDWKNYLKDGVRNKFYENLIEDIKVNVRCIFCIKC